MNKAFFILFVILLPALTFAQNYHIDWCVIGSGGGTSQSANYQVSGTVGEPIVGSSSSANYRVDAGFWVGAGSQGGGGCAYIPGDINGNGIPNGIDVVFGVNYFKGISTPPDNCSPVCPDQPSPFYAAVDVNANCAANGIDITFFVRYLKGQTPSLLYCADCPPAGMSSPPVMPIEMPIQNAKFLKLQ